MNITKRNLEQQAKECEESLNELDENSTEEERKIVEDEAERIDTESSENDAAILEAEEEIRSWEREITELRSKMEAKPILTPDQNRKEIKEMNTRKFFNLTAEERSQIFASDEVRSFLKDFREKGLEASNQKRTISGAQLGIPTVFLDIIRENIINYSKLINRVRLRSVNGKSRQIVMGTIPEAVWTEMCAAINEIDFGFNQVEVDGYKLGALIYICRATLEDSSDIDLAYEIVEALLVSLGIGIDKAILYGLGTKMPLGIAVRLAQTSEPSDYPQQARAWENLNSHLITIDSSITGIDFFRQIVAAGGLTKGKYSRSTKFWAMNESTYTMIKIQGMNANAEGKIVTIEEGIMPVAGGDIIVLSDDIIPDNNIIAGYGDLYLLAERAGSNIERSDEYRFAEDQVAFKGTARYDGVPVIPEGFVVIGIGAAPITSATFAGDKANDATLSDLIIGDETLSPTFNPAKYDYTLAASKASATVNAVASQTGAQIKMQFDNNLIANGQNIKFTAGEHTLTVKVSKGLSTLTYTVKISKAGE
ncbi:hypothetical protein IMSAG250_00722 [Clostridiales bacterium]|nr:hypothetical protein IMSAG250_00722 [Clostridiales bacterium]